MFKERLKVVGMKVGAFLLATLCIFGAIAIIFWLGFLAGEYVVGAILSFIVHAMVILTILTIVTYVIESIYKFINWLFIEPYKVRKKRG